MKTYSILSIQIGVIILFIISSTFMIFIGESFLYFFSEFESMDKTAFLKFLTKSFIHSLIIDSGLIVFYFINLKRIKNGKNPI